MPADQHPLLIPGVSAATIAAAGLRRVLPAEAEALCGLRVAGTWIPYYTLSGSRVQRPTDSPQGYGRLRLDHPDHEGRRYHQRAGSKAYGYLVPDLLAPLNGQRDLVIAEGEKKALALLDAGIAAVGIGGLTLAIQDGQLVPGLRELAEDRGELDRILFLGDGDTSLIFGFSREAVKLKRLFPDVPVACPRIGLDGPGKGIDDVRAAIGADAFSDYWTALVAASEPVGRDDSAEALAVRLLKRETPQKLKEAASGKLS